MTKSSLGCEVLFQMCEKLPLITYPEYVHRGCLANPDTEMLHSSTEVHKEEHNCYSNPMFENINLTNPHALESIGHFSLKYKFFTISNWKSFYDLIKESACNEGDPGSIPGSGRSPGEGNGYPLQYPCLENPHGQRSLVGHSPWGCRELDTMDRLTLL